MPDPYYPVDLSIPIQPGQDRDPSRDIVFKKIAEVLNYLLKQAGVTSITDTDQIPIVLAIGAVEFSGSGVTQDGNKFIFSGGGGGGGSGTVTSISAVAPLVAAPNPIVGAGTLSHAASGAVAGSYSNPSIAIDIFGHILSAASGNSTVPTAAAFGHTITANSVSLFMQQITLGDTIQDLPQLIGGADRGIIAIYINRSGFTVIIHPHAGETINGAAGLILLNGQGGLLLGLAGAGSTGDWSE